MNIWSTTRRVHAEDYVGGVAVYAFAFAANNMRVDSWMTSRRASVATALRDKHLRSADCTQNALTAVIISLDYGYE